VDDLYEILGIAPDASDDELRRVWRQLARKWHPDSAGTDTTFIFQRLLDAYETLADPVKRAAYDRARGSVVAPVGPRAPGVMLTRVSGSLEILLARGVVREVDTDVYDLVLEDEERASGGMITIAMNVRIADNTERFAAWLAVRPGAAEGTELRPSTLLPGMTSPPRFRVRTR
jgi:curved DNA-binding protein CbpA